MALKSIQKYTSHYMTPENYPWVADMVSEIEREIAERYMELPVDADGVPIRVGDIVKCTFADDNATVKYLSLQEDGWSVVVEYPDGRGHRTPKSMRHVKLRTIEDVLNDLMNDDQWDEDGSYEETKRRIVAKYADELRNMGVGE